DPVFQSFHEREQPAGRVAFRRILKRAGSVGRARLPPLIGLRIRRPVCASPVHINVMSDTVEPGRKSGPPLEGIQRSPNLEKRPLRQVSGIVVIAAETPEPGENPLIIEAD